jgi:hypothetical protein
MRLLPRSPRGIWLLAAAVWLAGCAVLWPALPALPRASITVPGIHQLLGFGPGGRSILFEGDVDASGNGPLTVSIRAWNTADGSVWTIAPARDFHAPRTLSPNGRWLVVEDWLGGVQSVRLIDVATGHETELSHRSGAPIRRRMTEFSPDSHWLAVAEQEHESRWMSLPGVRVWDLTGPKPGADLAAAVAPVKFSADGQRLAALTWPSDAPAGTVDYVVWETATGRELARQRKPQATAVAAFTPDNSGLIVHVAHDASPSATLGFDYVCWDIADGRERWSVRDLCQCLAPTTGGRWLVMSNLNSAASPYEAVILNINNGTVVNRVELEPEGWLTRAGPDMGTLLIGSPRRLGLDVLWDWLARPGLMGPRPGSTGHVDLVDAATGRRVFSFPGGDSAYSADGQSLAVLDSADVLTVWDIPPRKPLMWFVVAAALLILPLVWLARRRVRKLRRLAEVAA